MPAWLIVVLVVVALLVLGAAAWYLIARQRTDRLRRRFGPEYQRTVETLGSRTRAETDLEARSRRVERLHIHPLPSAERDRFAERWRATQSLFVDDPAKAVADAERLVQEVMQARGYPIGDFDQRAADISVDHPHVVENYREARRLALVNQSGKASTEERRKAMVHYRALFDDLLEAGSLQHAEVRR